MLRLLDSRSPRDQARLLEQTSDLGTAWMSVIPSAPLRTIINSEDYTLALKWWLGLPLFHGREEERTCPGCGRPCDLFGDRLLYCARNNFSRKHNAVQEVIANLLQASGQGFTTEAKVPDCPDGELRPADILLSCCFKMVAPPLLPSPSLTAGNHLKGSRSLGNAGEPS